MRHLFSASLISLLVLLTESRAAVAQTPSADPKEMARSAGEEGLSLYRDGKFTGAYERFAMAEQIAHSPVFLLWMARSKRGNHELLAARRLFERVVGEQLAPGASAKWVTAREEATAELAVLAAKIPRIKIALSVPPAGTTLELDGVAVEADREIEVDPGAHTARAVAPGREPASKRVEVEEGTTTIELRFGETESPAPGSLVPGAVLLGAGLLGVVGGAVTGGYALVLAGEVNEGCQGNVCLASDEQKAADADTLARASTGLFIAGGIVSAAGVVLLVLRPRIGGDVAAFEVTPNGARVRMRF